MLPIRLWVPVFFIERTEHCDIDRSSVKCVNTECSSGKENQPARETVFIASKCFMFMHFLLSRARPGAYAPDRL